VSSRPDSRQISIICLDDVFVPSGPLHCIEKVLSSLHPSGHFNSTSGRLSVSISFRFLSKFQERKDQSTVRTMWYPVRTCVSLRQESQFKYHRPDVSQPWSERACNVYGNCRFDFNRPDACPSWSGRAYSRYGNCVLKISHSDVPPPWSGCAKPYKEITCSGRATVRTSVSHRLDDVLKQERFSENPVALLPVLTASVQNTAVAHLNPQPINRGP